MKAETIKEAGLRHKEGIRHYQDRKSHCDEDFKAGACWLAEYLMTRERIERAANEAVQEHFQCNGKYPCEERDYCEFCNGHNSAFDCREDCGADDFNKGFFVGAEWRINSVWHDMKKEVPQVYGEYENEVAPSIPCLVRGYLSFATGT